MRACHLCNAWDIELALIRTTDNIYIDFSQLHASEITQCLVHANNMPEKCLTQM